MFKNRVRTAALAGAIAVATGVSGLSVPAYAQTLPTDNQGLHLNDADGSTYRQGGTAYVPTATATAEQQGLNAQKNVTKFIANEIDVNGPQGTVELVQFLEARDKTKPLDPSEQAALDSFRARHAATKAALAESAKNEADAYESTKQALALDNAAREAVEKYVGVRYGGLRAAGKYQNDEAGRAAAAELNAVVKDANRYNTKDLHNLKGTWGNHVSGKTETVTPFAGTLNPEASLGVPAELVDEVKQYGRGTFSEVKPGEAGSYILLAQQVQAYLNSTNDLQAENVGGANNPINGDNADTNGYVNADQYRIVAQKLAQTSPIKEILEAWARYGELPALEADMRAKTRAAQASDAILLQALQRRAKAQTDLLRAVEANYRIGERLIELYENDVLFNDGDDYRSLRNEYLNGLIRVNAGIVDQYNRYEVADKDFNDNFNRFSTANPNLTGTQYRFDLQDFKIDWATGKITDVEGDFFRNKKKEFANEVYANIVKNSLWQNEIARLDNLSAHLGGNLKVNNNGLNGDQANSDARVKDLEKQLDEAKKREKELKDKLANQNSNGNDKQNQGKGNGSTGSGNSQTGDSSDKKQDDKGLKIFGIIAGIIAAIAALVGLGNLPQVQAHLKR